MPEGIRVPSGASAEAILGAFLRLPYRKDGTVSEDARHTLWARPDKTFREPGFNCSGFTLAAARFLLGVNFTLEEARRDIRSDSGAGSELGEDWDFGLDEILNLARRETRLFPYQEEPVQAQRARGRKLGLGVDVKSDAFERALDRIAPGRLYFFAISKPDGRFKGGLSYYHNGIALRGEGGEVLLYHSTGRAGVNRMNLSSASGLATFRKYYPPVRGGERRIVFVEAVPPPCPGLLPSSGGAPPPAQAPGLPSGRPWETSAEPPALQPLEAPPPAPLRSASPGIP
jgi:cell wall-associated NlpC family hydrolase